MSELAKKSIPSKCLNLFNFNSKEENRRVFIDEDSILSKLLIA